MLLRVGGFFPIWIDSTWPFRANVGGWMIVGRLDIGIL